MALYQHVPADKVPAAFKELAKDWPTWDSNDADPPLVDGKVHFNYDGDYGSERVLVINGKATITPDDGSPAIDVGEGDAVYLFKGFSCTWTILEPLVQHYGYFGADGKEIKQTELTCDICGDDCFEESYLFNDEVDICPRCFISDSKGAEEYEGAEYQREGVKATKPAKRARKSSTGGTDFDPDAEEKPEEKKEKKAKSPKKSKKAEKEEAKKAEEAKAEEAKAEEPKEEEKKAEEPKAEAKEEAKEEEKKEE
jgi:hypothetical protein